MRQHWTRVFWNTDEPDGSNKTADETSEEPTKEEGKDKKKKEKGTTFPNSLKKEFINLAETLEETKLWDKFSLGLAPEDLPNDVRVAYKRVVAEISKIIEKDSAKNQDSVLAELFQHAAGILPPALAKKLGMDATGSWTSKAMRTFKFRLGKVLAHLKKYWVWYLAGAAALGLLVYCPGLAAAITAGCLITGLVMQREQLKALAQDIRTRTEAAAA